MRHTPSWLILWPFALWEWIDAKLDGKRMVRHDAIVLA